MLPALASLDREVTRVACCEEGTKRVSGLARQPMAPKLAAQLSGGSKQEVWSQEEVKGCTVP